MRATSRYIFGLLSLIIVSSCGASAANVPPLLAPWSEWVLEGEDHRSCPLIATATAAAREDFVCAWSSPLNLVVTAQSARFEFKVRVYAATFVELPGDERAWPVQVLVNGAPLAVVQRGAAPALQLAPGSYQIAGELAFATRPERLALPQLIAAVELTLDGKRVERIKREDGMLWLGQLEREATQADALTLQVFRRIDDDLPILQTLALRVDVAGRAREVAFDEVLGKDFVPLALRSELPAQINERGDLKIKLEPGSFVIYVDGRALTMQPQLQPTAHASPWPDEEIFSYASNARIRVSQARAPRPIDANTLDMPAEWKSLPAFVLNPEEQLVIEETARGRLSDARNALSLERTAWLRFDGSEWRFRDALGGRMTRDFRVDLNAPLTLLSARIGSEDRLITAGAKPGQRGVEIREGSFSLSADSSMGKGGWQLPVGAWDLDLEQSNWSLNLPPGYRLLHAAGASQAPETWLERFSLLDVFLILLALVLVRRALGNVVAIGALVFFAVAYHEHPGFALLLAALAGLQLVEQALPKNLLRRFAVALRWALLALLALGTLSFAVQQVRLALYPQLETGTMSYGVALNNMAPIDPVAVNMQEQAASAEGMMQSDAVQSSRESQNNVAAAPMNKSMVRRQLNRYAQDVVVQAGVGMPNWRWRGYTLRFQGPITTDQTVRLWISPAWATRLGRLLALFGLGWVLAGFFQRTGIALKPLAPALMVLVLLPLVPSVQAQSLPSSELLTELKTRLTKPPLCAPVCADLAALSASANGNTVVLNLELHADTLAAVPLPTFADGWQPTTVEVDGASAGYLARNASGASFIALTAGVHAVRLTGSVAGMDRFKLSLPLKPRALKLDLSGWSALGLREGTLLSANLELVRERGEDAASEPASSTRADSLLPFVRVTRRFDFGSDFSIETQITRVAPMGESLNLKLPLLAGEQVLSGTVAVNKGMIEIALPGDSDSLSFVSRLERNPTFTLTAGDFAARAETWVLAPGDEWRLAMNGSPALEALDPNEAFVYEFRPRPGEKLDVSLSRPQAIAGATLALDEIVLGARVGPKAQDYDLRIAYRATRSQQHAITVPQGLELLSITTDGQTLPIRPQNGTLSLPITPGAHTLDMVFRETRAVGFASTTPAFDLKLASANITLTLAPPGNRWALRSSGPQLGAAVLYWGELVFALLLAVVIARLGLTPLSTLSWLLLVLGFSTWSWFSLLIVVVWLHALSLRPRYIARFTDGNFNFVQVVLALLTLVALAAIVLSIPLGLLGDPDMHVDGFGSSSAQFRWFADHALGVLPTATVYSVPKWIYQLLMLSFALWLAVALSGWLRWGYRAYAEHGLWRERATPQPPQLAPAADAEKPL